MTATIHRKPMDMSERRDLPDDVRTTSLPYERWSNARSLCGGARSSDANQQLQTRNRGVRRGFAYYAATLSRARRCQRRTREGSCVRLSAIELHYSEAP